MSPQPPKKGSKAEKSVTWGKRPSTRPPAVTGSASADSFVQGAKPDLVRLNLNIPRPLHARIKSQCALRGSNMTDAIMELLESHFPEPKE